MDRSETKDTVGQWLDEYSQAKDEIHNLGTEAGKAIKELLGEELFTLMEEISDQLQKDIAPYDREVKSLEQDIKSGVKNLGKSVAGESHECVFTPGGHKWNTTMVEGFALAHPGLLGARETTDPRVAIRKRTGKK